MKIERNYTERTAYDVIVCGGGPAGVSAAIAAARGGAKTLLIESDGALGGFWVNGFMTWLIDTRNKPGLMQEYRERLMRDAGGADYPTGIFSADTESAKVMFEELCREAGVTVRLYTRVTGVVKDGRRVTHVLTESKSGAECFPARFIIDATGDGDVAAMAGCRYELGNGEGLTQPMSLIGQIAGIPVDAMAPYDARFSNANQQTLCAEFESAGVSPSYRNTLLACTSAEQALYALMINHEYEKSADSADDLTEATLDGRREIFDAVKKLRERGGVFSSMALTATAPHIGIREGRRIRGLYTVTVNDVLTGQQHEDAVCDVTFGIDVHALKKNPTGFDDLNNLTPKPYQIPLRALIAADVDGLLMGGRCLSGDFAAHSSYRVAGNAVRTGEAAGAAAAYCVKENILPQQIRSITPWLSMK